MNRSTIETLRRRSPLPSLILAASLVGLAGAVPEDPKPAPVAAEPPAPNVASGEGSDADRPPAPPRRVGPVVRSANEAADRLRPPGSADDPYDESIDWRDVPAWQQASFYGVRARGSFFVYVVDCSGSMAADFRLERAKRELRRSINALRFPQRFLIIFFNHRSIPLGGGLPRSADAKNARAASAWIDAIPADGGTDPRAAMKLALGLRPDAVFLLTDGEFPSGTESTLRNGNPDRIPIHCIDLGGGHGAEQLRAIAEASGGRYAARPSD